jgi:hypothetical protein
MKGRVAAVIAALFLGACEAGWATWVENDSGSRVLVRYFEAGEAVVVSVEPDRRGLLGLGNAPGPASLDILDEACSFLDSVALPREGGTLVLVSDRAGSISGNATGTPLPQEITEPHLPAAPDVCQGALRSPSAIARIEPG